MVVIIYYFIGYKDKSSTWYYLRCRAAKHSKTEDNTVLLKYIVTRAHQQGLGSTVTCLGEALRYTIQLIILIAMQGHQTYQR